MRSMLVVILVLLTAGATAQEGIRRRPAAVDYEVLLRDLDATCNECNALLSRKEPNSSPVAIVRTSAGGAADTEKLSAFFLTPSNDEGSVQFHARDHLALELPRARLEEKVETVTEVDTFLAKATARSTLTSNASLVVPKGAIVDTARLIAKSRPEQFVIEQRSDPQRFSRNLARLRDRESSAHLTVFDFTPRTKKLIRSMGAGGTQWEWREFSRRLNEDFAKVGGGSAIAKRSLPALEERLQDRSGGVVLIYAHAIGTSIQLDTDKGKKSIDPAWIAEVGRAANHQLPPVILVNCSADPVLAEAFLEAGSPFVAATDVPLRLIDASNLLSHLATAVYSEGRDVIDAYFDAQTKAQPPRLRGLAHNVWTDDQTPARDQAIPSFLPR